MTRLAGSSLRLGARLVLSYYKLKQPPRERLTDEAGREMLVEGEVQMPAWIDSFFSLEVLLTT